jgi:hypothetical protein
VKRERELYSALLGLVEFVEELDAGLVLAGTGDIGARLGPSASEVAVDVRSVADLDHGHRLCFLIDFVDHAIVANAKTVELVLAFQLLDADRERIFGQGVDMPGELLLAALREG